MISERFSDLFNGSEHCELLMTKSESRKVKYIVHKDDSIRDIWQV